MPGPRPKLPFVKVAKRTCKNRDCRKRFVQERPRQIACCPECALAVAAAMSAKQAEARARAAKRKERAEDKERKEALMTLPELLKWSQKFVNRWVVHVRDKDKPCFSCGEYREVYDAGHYISVGAGRASKRFVEMNIHRQCIPCNQHKHSNHDEYRRAMVEEYGEESVRHLESEWPAWHPTREEARAIGDEYRKRLRDAGVKL
jgi:hypothetical protein